MLTLLTFQVTNVTIQDFQDFENL